MYFLLDSRVTYMEDVQLVESWEGNTAALGFEYVVNLRKTGPHSTPCMVGDLMCHVIQ